MDLRTERQTHGDERGTTTSRITAAIPKPRKQIPEESLPHLEFHAVPAQDRKNEGEEAGGEPENGGRGEIVGLWNGGGRKFGTALDKVAADNVLDGSCNVAGNTHDAESRAGSLARDYVYSHETCYHAIEHADEQTEERHIYYIHDVAALREKEQCQ